ncbi:tRNA 4-thiouridine(8) synthase ThiI, partial [archaeon]|nr:tRNA 4-thiouridine(8) synthase ThiI [archaeon]
MYVLIHHSEIILKGKNRRFFEKKLIDNIKYLFDDVKVLKDLGGILFEIIAPKEEITTKLKNVFGIKYFAFVEIIDRDKLFEKVEEIIKTFSAKTLAPITKRADKSYPLKSPEINAKIGEISNKHG